MKAKKPVVVAGVGEVLWDLLPAGKRAGGAPINFVYHAAQLGAEGYAISAVGNDALGAEILQELKSARIRYVISVLPYPTGRVQVELNKGVPQYTIVEDVAWDHIPLEQAAVDVIKKADCICYGTLALRSADSRKTIEALLSSAPKKALRFFDVNLRGKYYSKGLIEKLLRKANVFKLNDEELPVLREMFGLKGSEEKACRSLLETFRLRYVIFTAAEKYSAVYAPDETSRLKTPKVKVADTVGAGDAFSGAFVYNILKGKSLRAAHEAAVKVSAFVCTKTGAWPKYE